MEQRAAYQPETPESVWAGFREVRELLKESEAKFYREMAASNAKFKEEMAASRADFEQRSADFDRRMKNLDEMIGGVSNSNGMFAEEFFFNALDTGNKNLFGEHFDACYSLVKRHNKEQGYRSEHDILLVNGKAVAIIEVKYKARKSDIHNIINRLPTFRALFPEHRDRQIFLGLAAMSFDRGIEEESARQGVAIVKQVGDTVVINDAHLKAF